MLFHCDQGAYYVISFLLNLLKFVLWHIIYSILNNVPCEHEKNVFCSPGQSVLQLILSDLNNQQCKPSISLLIPFFFSLLIFCLVVLSISESEVLKSPTIIAELSVSLLRCISFCSPFLALFLGAYVYICQPSCWINPFIIIKHSALSPVTIFILKSILFDIYIVTLALDQLLSAWYIFFHPFIMSHFVSLNIKFLLQTEYSQIIVLSSLWQYPSTFDRKFQSRSR